MARPWPLPAPSSSLTFLPQVFLPLAHEDGEAERQLSSGWFPLLEKGSDGGRSRCQGFGRFQAWQWVTMGVFTHLVGDFCPLR